MTNGILKTLTKLVNNYKNAKNLTASDYVNQYFNYEDQVEQKELINAFLTFNQHEKYLEDIANLFLKECKFFRANIQNVKVQIFFIMFMLNSDNIEDILGDSHYYTKDMLQFLLTENNHKVIARNGCKYFENEHILQNIIEPFLGRKILIETVINNMTIKPFIKSPPRRATIPAEFRFEKLFLKSPAPPANTPTEIRSFHAINPPPTTKTPQLRVMQKLEEAHIRNREKSLQLLEESSNMSKRLSEPRKTVVQVNEPRPTVLKVKSIPPRKNVQIKENLTTTLREAARLLKQQEQEIQTIENIIKGGCPLQKIEQLELKYRKQQNQQELDNIQRKRLQGLISYEEAIIAKKKLLDDNKNRVNEFKKVRALLLQKLEEWRVEEQEKIKEHVEKCQQSKKDLKEMERQHLEDKQSRVRMQQLETKKMLRKAYEEKNKELAKKIDLIQEIKTIHEINTHMNAMKEFDPTETQNLGLFCEMSIAELQERLAIEKMKMKEELDAKRQQILHRKAKQQEAIGNVKNFIAQSRRMSKTKTVPICSPKLERSPSLLQLEKLLHEKRSLRLKIT